MADLSILPVKQIKSDYDDTTTGKKPIPDVLPQKHFLLVVCSPVRGGKTNLITNLLYNENIDYSEHFEDVIFVSPTIENDRTGRHIMKDERIIKITDDLDNLDMILESIVQVQKERLQAKEKSDTLLILDDCLGLLGQHNSYFSTLCSKYRHFRLSIIVTTQSFKSIPNITRYNSTAYILMRTFNKKQYIAMEEELEGSFPDFSRIYDAATSQRYSFLYLDMEKLRAYRDFHELLYDRDTQHSTTTLSEESKQEDIATEKEKEKTT